MKRSYFRFIAAVTFLLFIASAAFSKLALSSLFIAGGKLSQPIEVKDAKLLQASNPWFGTFIPQWNQAPLRQTAHPPETTPRFELSFYATSSPQGQPQIVYVVYYAFDKATRRGFVYLPGSHEKWYDTNAGSIVRPNQDGRWNLGAPDWCDQINSIISRESRQKKSS